MGRPSDISPQVSVTGTSWRGNMISGKEPQHCTHLTTPAHHRSTRLPWPYLLKCVRSPLKATATLSMLNFLCSDQRLTSCILPRPFRGVSLPFKKHISSFYRPLILYAIFFHTRVTNWTFSRVQGESVQSVKKTCVVKDSIIASSTNIPTTTRHYPCDPRFFVFVKKHQHQSKQLKWWG